MSKYDDLEITRRVEVSYEGYAGKGHVETRHEPVLHPGEPFFFLRAQDLTAVPAVLNYAHRVEQEGKRELAESARDVAARMVAWQSANKDKVKLPD